MKRKLKTSKSKPENLNKINAMIIKHKRNSFLPNQTQGFFTEKLK